LIRRRIQPGNPKAAGQQEDDPVMLETRQRAWRMLWLLIFLLPATPCEAASPSLVGAWQGSSPVIHSTYCSNRAVTINIVQQCGNLFRGNAVVAGSTTNFVGSLKGGTYIYMHGYTAGGDMFMVFGEYQAGSPPHINVSYYYDSNLGQEEYDAFQLTYTGPVKPKGNSGLLQLLLLD
jgi:hypothetical protein